MANNIKGITIEIGGNTGPLTSALKDVNKAAGDAQGELKKINNQLKFDPKNVVLSAQKLDVLKQKSEALQEKQKTLKTAVEQAHAAFEKGNLGADKVRAVEYEYEKVNSQLKETKKDLAAAEAESGSFTEKVKGKFSLLKDKIKDTFSAENVKAGIGAVGVAVGGFLKGSVDEAKEAEKANADLAQTLKSTKNASGMTVDSLNDLSQAMVKNTTFSDTEVKAGEGMLLTFTQIGKDVFPQATAATLDYAQKMGVDAKSAALTLGKALNDPANGLAKLTKSGVTFTDQQKKQITAMQKAGDTAGAQKLMIQELNKEFGGQAAAAAETYDGKQKQVANTMKEIKEIIGTALMPALAALLKPIVPIIQAIGNFVSKNPQLTAAILAVIAVVGTLIGGMQLLTAVTSFLGIAADASLAPILPVILAVTAAVVGLSAIAIAVVTHWKQVSGFFIGLWNTIKGLFAGIGNWFKSVFSAGADGTKSAWSGITGFFSGVWNGIKGLFAGIGNWFTSVFTAGANGVKSAWSKITNFYSGVWSGIKSGALAAWDGIRTATIAVVTPIVKAVVSIWNSMKGGIQTAMNGLKNILSGIWTVIKNVVMLPVILICDLITGNFRKMGSDVGHIFTNVKNALTQIWVGIRQVFFGAVQAIGGFLALEWHSIVTIATSVWNAFSSFMSSLWNGICSTAVNAWNGLIGFFNALPGRIGGIMNAIGSWIQSVWNGLVGFLSGLPARIGGIMDSIGSWIQGVWNGIVGFVSGIPGRFAAGLSGIGNAVRGAFSSAISFIQSLPGEALHWGSDIINGIVNGIKGAVGHVRDAVNGVAQNIRSFLHFSVPDEGPLADFESWMPDFMKGLANGIRSSTAPVFNAAKGVASGIAASIRIPQTITSGLQLRTALAAAGGYSSGSSGSTSGDSISRSPIPGLTVIFKGNSFGDKEVAKTDVDKISNAIALKVQAQK